MLGVVREILSKRADRLPARILAIAGLLVGFNALAWLWALSAFHDHPVLLGTALLAYSFGLRHAVDADHIAAIDNVTRKLMSEGKRPVAIGFFFSLGHSTIVVLLSIVVAIGAALVQTNLPQWKEAGGLIGTFVSATFLYVIGIINLL